MRKIAVIAALFACATFIGCRLFSTEASAAGSASSHASLVSEYAKSKMEECPFLKPGGPIESKPQSLDYRGGCLEFLPHVELASGGGLSMFTGVSSDGSPVPTRFANAHFDESMVELKMEPVDVGPHPFGQVQFYKVTTKDGTELCKDQTYDTIPESSEQLDPKLLGELRGKAIAIPGYWEGAAWKSSVISENSKTSFSLSCMSGAMAKCALWGYKPWSHRDGVGLEDYHVACVQAARASYIPSHKTSYTCKGTVVDIYDRLGILTKDLKNTSFQFESIWKKNGPDCLTKSRFPICDNEVNQYRSSQTRMGAECKDPADSGWPVDVLITIRSSLANEVTDPYDPDAGPKCPSQLENGCDQTRRP